MPTPSKDTTVYAAPVMRKLAETVSELPPSLRKVADFILRHPLKAATLTIEEMAHETLTSPAAVNRLAKALDLGGYSGMKAELVATLPGERLYAAHGFVAVERIEAPLPDGLTIPFVRMRRAL